MWLSHLGLALGWIVYGAVHSILASQSCKNFVARKFPAFSRYYRLTYIIIACITLIPLLVMLFKAPGYLTWEPGPISRITGSMGVLIGSIIMFIILRVYFRAVNSVGDLVTETSGAALFQNGLHSRVRHPLYLGTFFLIWGIFFLLPLGSLLVTNIIITLYTLLGIRFEEKKLIASFGDVYLRYMKEVPMIWPRLGKKPAN